MLSNDEKYINIVRHDKWNNINVEWFYEYLKNMTWFNNLLRAQGFGNTGQDFLQKISEYN